MDINEMLYDEIQDEFAFLKGVEVGTEEYEKAVSGVSKLVDRAIEYERVKNEREKVEKEHSAKIKAMDDERIDRWIKNGISAAGIVAGVGVTVWGTLKTFKFEETGSVSSIIGRGYINRLFFKK